MGKGASGPGAVHIDERWLTEWFDKGMRDLVAFLACYARFEAWCAEHQPEETL